MRQENILLEMYLITGREVFVHDDSFLCEESLTVGGILANSSTQ